MIKSELTQQLAKELTDISEKNVATMVNHVLVMLSQTVAANKRVEIRGFGSFSLHHRPARTARNPRTHKEVTTAAKYLPHFKPGKELKDRVNASNEKIRD
jgi:integration host factor subunit beta